MGRLKSIFLFISVNVINLSLLLESGYCFNLDTRMPLVKTGVSESYFGFSVAQHFVFDESRGTGRSVMLVGAPRDNVTDPTASPAARQVVRPGVVYQCPLTTYTNDCAALKIDRGAGSHDAEKDDQWLGVSVSSQGTDNGKAVACAHRFKKADTGYRYGLGICISMLNSLDEDEFWEPCNSLPKNEGHGQYGFCQVGTDVDVSRDGDMLLGSPGPYNWRGVVFKNIIRESLYEEKTWFQSPVEDFDKNKPVLDHPATSYYSYLGMSVKIGNIINGQKTYVAGAPRSKDSGQVLLFQAGTNKLKITSDRYLTGEQFGSCFGYDIAIVDLNSDGRDDLVVGAPFYHGQGVGGAIYIYINSEKGIDSITKPIKIVSPAKKEAECAALNCHNSRFGYAVSNIGDVDQDGYADIAIGAPFEGDGAVYIYRGSPDGIVSDYSQRIYASELMSSTPLKAFGSSLAGGMDMDLSGYPDVVVGSYETGSVTLLRARPVFNVFAGLRSIPQQIDPRVTSCVDGRQDNCFELELCARFTAKPTSSFTGQEDLLYRIEAEKIGNIIRVQFKGKTDVQSGYYTEGTLRMFEQSNNRDACVQHLVYIQDSNKDFLNPIVFHLTYKLRERQPRSVSPGDPLPVINDYPILDAATAEQILPVDFVKNCGTDQVCLSNLMVDGTLKGLEKDSHGNYKVHLDKVNELNLLVSISNKAEDAHEATLNITLPDMLDYRGTDEAGKQYSCLPTNNYVTCSIGNPLRLDESVSFSVRLDPSRLTTTTNRLNITLRMNTTSTETNTQDDVSVIRMIVLIETDIAVLSRSEPTDVYFSGEIVGESAIRFFDEIGTEIKHYYEVKVFGSGRVPRSTLEISWPYEVASEYEHGKHLLYMVDYPEMEGPIQCDVPKERINPLGIEDRSESEKDRSIASTDQLKSRRRRDTTRRERQIISSDYSKVVTLDCTQGKAKCFHFKCDIGELQSQQSVVVTITARLWNSTFLEDYTEVDQVLVLSRGVLTIDRSLNINQTNVQNDKGEAVTKVFPDIAVQGPPRIPLWIILVAVAAGLILLIVIIVILWRCGFFRRKTPEELQKAKLEKHKNYDDYD